MDFEPCGGVFGSIDLNKVNSSRASKIASGYVTMSEFDKAKQLNEKLQIEVWWKNIIFMTLGTR